MTYLVAPLNKELHDLGDLETDVFAILRLFPDYYPTVGLGFQQEGFEQPAAMVLYHDGEFPPSVVEDVEAQGLAPELFNDDEYAKRAFTESEVTNGDV